MGRSGFRKVLINGGFKVFDSLPSGGGDAKGFGRLDAEAEELGFGERVAEIGFVQYEEDGLFRLEGGFSDVFIFIVGVFRAVESEEDEVGGINGVGDLILDASFEVIVGVFQAGGVDEEEAVVDVRHNVITGRALFSGDDSDVFMGETIQKAGFASVGLADECDDREFLHIFIIAKRVGFGKNVKH